MKIKFKKWDCKLVATYYNTEGRKALMLIDAKNNDLVAMATVNMPDFSCENDQVYVKSYSKNEGMLKTLIDHGIILPKPVKEIKTSFVIIPLMNLTPKGMKLWNPKKRQN